ncbi:CHAT domain-containing protein [Rugosimonospora africana]|uniref:CHAT domain-containing protein n=1 Tax=Rugosimonospora africana TaxID=556532 RepID=A0A8J3QWY9_9ACTN|nr:CHAT domain-containing tetratricopeptide repeat protein [Rugosimonospora africana]GIH17632.1 CHAT domain-containing protein [Rugosimonospora africana]
MTVHSVEPTVRRLHRDGVAAMAQGRPADAVRLQRAGLALLGFGLPIRVGASGAAQRPGPVEDGTTTTGGRYDALAGRLLISLAYAEAERGRTRYGFELLTLAGALIEPDDRGVLVQQRALMLLRTGRFTDALADFDEAIPLLGGERHLPVLCTTLLNRAALYLHAGRVRAAREDLASCERLAQRGDLPLVAAKALHNAGYCDLLSGDLPRALDAFGAAEPLFGRHGPGFLPMLTAARARALLSAGLAREAGRSLDGAVTEFARHRLSQELAEAELLRAQAALGYGDHAAAASRARRAERLFRRRGNDAWVGLATLARLRAQLPGSRAPGGLAARAAELAGRLRAMGLARDAEMADLLAARALVAAGRTGRARDVLAAIPRGRPNESLELSLTRRIVRAELAAAEGRRGPALTEIRRGLAVLDDHRSRLGSRDLQVGITALGRELAAAGFDTVVDGGSPAAIFDWSERSRAQAFGVPPVRPPADPVLAEALAELRQLRESLRTAELERRRVPGARTRCAELERTIRERVRRVAGPGQTVPVAGLAEIEAELAASDRVMLSFLTRHGRLHALLVDAGTVRMVALGDHASVEDAVARLRYDLDALTGRRLPAALDAAIRGSVTHQLDVLSRELMTGLRAELADRELVIVPTMALSSLPWGLLPELRGRPVTVSASASAWLRARRRPVPGERVPGEPVPPLLVAGPDLDQAEVEIGEIAKVYPGSRALTGAEATVAATLAGLDGAPIAHLAAHGHHEHENVLFSRLDLADGPLMAYDIQRLAAAPASVTLSACDVGRTVVAPGDEILGFTAALLYAGTASVVASVARVTHHAAAEVMTGYHCALADGARPARALADASLADPFAPFVCFGAG